MRTSDALRIHHVRHHPLRACYPYGTHDLLIDLTQTGPDVPTLLRTLLPTLFAESPHCRRVIAAPKEEDTRAQEILEEAGFLRVTEADLPDATVILFTAEPPALAGISTALDDMPH